MQSPSEINVEYGQDISVENYNTRQINDKNQEPNQIIDRGHLQVPKQENI